MASKAFYAVVAGVGAGTGAATALRFAKSYPVVLLARKPESYKDLVEEIKKSGGQAIGISTDTSDPASVTSAFESIKKELPESKLAAAVYNVGAGFGIKPFLESSAEELQSSLAANPYVPVYSPLITTYTDLEIVAVCTTLPRAPCRCSSSLSTPRRTRPVSW